MAMVTFSQRRPGTILTPRDIERWRDLRRTQFIATSLLAAAIVTFLLARVLQPHYPLLGFVAAIAEAAAIGGLADWFAVVALFRRPLGLPIPHTAIIPENQHRIAENLGEFIERQFLAPEPVAAKLKEIDFAAQIAAWLSAPERSGALARYLMRLLPQALAAIEQSGLRGFVAKRVRDQIESVQVAPLAAGFLTTFTEHGRHQRILDQIIEGLHGVLANPTTLDAIREKIRGELPALLNFYRADALILKRLVTSTASFLEEVRADENHPLRHEFDRFVRKFVDDLANSGEFARRAEEIKHEVLARPELAEFVEQMWGSLQEFLHDHSGEIDSVLHIHLQGLLMEMGRQLQSDPKICAEINNGMISMLTTFVETQKSGISAFIADQVKSWNSEQLVEVIELNVGKDLQYIRFNGMLIGGLAGLLLYTLQVLLRIG